MTIPSDKRLEFLRGTNAAGSTYTSVERVEFVSILDELMEHRATRAVLQDENLGLSEELKRYQNLDDILASYIRENGNLREWCNAMDQRLSGLETWLAVANPNLRLQERFDRLGGMIDGLNARIDKVVEIIGERVEQLVNDNNVILDSAKRAHERIDVLERPWEHEPTEPAFPTGGASTAEAAAAVVLPVPQRGDRVRLEGARHGDGRRIEDGWYEVIGHVIGPPSMFQITTRESTDRDDLSAWLPWLQVTKALKEVRHADQR